MRLQKMLFAACAFSSFCLAAFAPRTAHAQTPIVFSGAAALGLPIGDLGNSADVGMSLAIRGEGRLASPGWSLRGDLSWDRFGGRGPINSYSYVGFAGNLVHHEQNSQLYEFGGLGLYGSKTSFVDDADHNDTNLGVQMGLGLNFSQGPHTPFVEFGLTSVFTSGNNSLWFPVRFGVRF